MGDNGEIKDNGALKREKFDKDPDQFIDKKDIIICALKTENGVAIGGGSGVEVNDLHIAQSKLNYNINKILIATESAQAKMGIKKPGRFYRGLFNK